MPVTIDNYQPEASSPGTIERWRQVPVAVAVDVSHAECQIDRAIRPLCPPGQQPRLFGRAVTALCEPPDFGAVLYALDKIKPGDVLVIAAGGHADTAMIGEILGGHLRRLGACGLVCDGAVRDVAELAKWNDLPVFSRAITPRGPTSAERGRVNCSVVVGGRLISPGDLVIGDDDGLASLDPKSIVKFIAEAEGKLAKEAEWQASLAARRTAAETFHLGTPQAGEGSA
ncbi:MAG TPA: dimethylmenaquinone methyltransferase [Aestuariivirga sp.]|nr:dimethylmenaquinone methyltransferase [Hyphomicrobiales bacterium]HQY74010.1 dimethylmenaquinone methyltransferase [Aestuariivirga sp.]